MRVVAARRGPTIGPRKGRGVRHDGRPVLGVLRVRVRGDGGDDSFRLPGHPGGRQGARILEKVKR